MTWYTQETRRLVKSIPIPSITAPIMVAEFKDYLTFAIDPAKNVVYSEKVKLDTDAYLAKIYRALHHAQVPVQIRGFFSNYGFHEKVNANA